MPSVNRILPALLLLLATSLTWAAPETETSPAEPGDLERARREAQRVMNAGLPFAEKMLGEYGEFAPFGAVMRPEGLIQNLAPDDPQDQTPVEQVYRQLVTGLAEGAQSGKYNVVATFVLVELPDPETGQPIVAVHVALEHRDGYCADIFFPTIPGADGGVLLGQSFAGRRDGEFFEGCL